MPIKKDAILIMVTNPVDILTLHALKFTKLPGIACIWLRHNIRKHAFARY